MGRMEPAELRARREHLGLTGEALAVALSVRTDTLRRWESGRDPIPYAVPDEIAALERHTDDIVAILTEHEDEQQWLATDDEARFAGRRDWCTARWWRHCMIRAGA